MVVRTVLGVGLVGVLLAGCAGHHPKGSKPHPQVAAELCASALPGTTIGSSTMTTVGDVRALRGGPNLPLAAGAFPGADPKTPAAWCWVSDGAQNWTAFAAGPGKVVRVAPEDGITFTPSGPPAIP